MLYNPHCAPLFSSNYMLARQLQKMCFVTPIAPISLPCMRHKQTPRSIYLATCISPYTTFSCARHAWMLRLVYVAGDIYRMNCSIFQQIHRPKSPFQPHQRPKFEIIGILFRYTDNSSELCAGEKLIVCEYGDY